MKNNITKYKDLEKKLAEAEKLIARLEKSKKNSTDNKNNVTIKETQDIAEAYITSEQNFKNTMDASPLGIRVITEDGDLIYANKAILDICGYKTPQELAAVPRDKLYTPESYKAHQERRRKRKLKEYVPLEYEIDIVRPSGEVRNLQVYRRGVMWGGEQQFMAMYQDITEHKRAEEALRESEERFHNIVEHSNDGIVFIVNGVLKYCNSKMLEMCKYTQKEVLGKSFIDFVAPEHKQIVAEIYHKRIAGKSVQERHDVNLLTKEGKRVYTEVSASLITIKQEPVDIVIIRDITERKKVEEQLANEEVRRRILIEQSRDGIVILDQNGKVYDANQRFARMLGYKMEEMRQLHVFDWEFLYPRERVVEMLSTVDEKGDHFETRHRRKDGTICDVEISTNGAVFAGQKLIFCVCRDITERKRMEKALRESEEKYSKAFVSSPAMVAITTLKEGKFVEVSDSWIQTTGYSRKEVIGKDTISLNAWANPKDRVRMLRILKEQGRVNKEEFNFHMKSGVIRTWLFSAEPITFGGEECLLGVSIDITERKQAEKKINYLNQTLRSIRDVNQLITREKNREKLLRGVCDTLIESSSFYAAWIVLFDESRNVITYAQSGMPDDVLPVGEAIKRGNIPSCVEKALKRSQVVIIEDPKKCTDCEIYDKTLNYGAMSVRLEYAGNIYGVLCASIPKEILTDIDELSLVQEVGSDIAFALYNMEREGEYKSLEQERLRTAKLESIGTLAGGIAHDFNNLLTGIMGNIGLVKTNMSPSDAAYEMLNEAENAAIRAKDLTQQLLTFARGGKPVKKSASIAGIIKESAAFAMRGSKAKLELSLPDDLYPIEADEGQISQVINNLIINADEAMPSGGTLKIQAKNLTLKKANIPPLPVGDYVRIDIADTGIGISSEHLQRIFEPYFTTKQRGSGLGLTTAYSIVRNHGGTIHADSKQNKGSTFHIYLPAAKKPTKGGKKMKVMTGVQAGGKVLVMDDEEIIRKMLKNMLSQAGYIVEVSADGVEALHKYKEAKKQAIHLMQLSWT